MNQNTNNEINKIVELLQTNEIYNINDEDLYDLFIKCKFINKTIKNKITKRSFPAQVKRYCRIKKYTYTQIQKNPNITLFNFYNN